MILVNVFFSFPLCSVQKSLKLNLPSRLKCIMTSSFHVSFTRHVFPSLQDSSWRLRCLHFMCAKSSLHSEAKGKNLKNVAEVT